MLEQYLEKLNKYQNFDINNNIEQFEKTLDDIGKLNNSQSIGNLVKYFNDESDYPEILFNIVHLIETFDDHTYLNELLPSMPWMVKNTPDWAKTLHYRILNSPKTYELYIDIFPSLSQQIKSCLKQLLSEIKKEDVEFEARCNKLLNKGL